MEQAFSFAGILLTLTTLFCAALFYRASRYSKPALIILLVWLAVQGLIAGSGFYLHTDGVPPRFTWTIIPPFALIAGLFLTNAGRQFVDRLDLRILTILHLVRLPVEIALHALFLDGTVPELMTYEGRNFDILSGITAPIIYYAAFRGGGLNRNLLLGWNIACIALLINIVAHAILSAPFAFQQLAFGQPNVAVLYFPAVWLPCCIVPIVLLCHLAAMRQLLRRQLPAA